MMHVQRELERFGSDAEYLDRHRQELLGRYPERWVAIYNHQVVGAAKDLKGLIRQLERKGIPPASAYREYLTAKEELLILASTDR